MAIKRYVAIADNTITNQYNAALSSQRTKANAGLADSLEIFKIYGQVNSSTVEQTRILIKFPVNETNLSSEVRTIKQDRDAGILPAKDSVKFFMKMYNVEHPQTVPRNFKLVAHPLRRTWDEGLGIDLDEYSDIGQSSWLSASSTTAWGTEGASHTGSDVNTSTAYLMEQEFDTGLEDFEVDITKYVEDVLSGDINSGNNYGHILQISSSYLSDSNSYYTKKFSARSSEYFFKRPVIEARWDSSLKDDRSNFYYSSSLCDSTNTLYLYNNVGGRLKNIPGNPSNIYVQLFLSSGSAPSGSALRLVNGSGVSNTAGGLEIVTGSKISTGIYSCSFAMTGTADTIHDVWYNGSSTIYHTGTIYPETRSLEGTTRTNDYYISITNLKKVYDSEETARFRIYSRLKGWSPTIYTRAVSEPQLYIPTSGSYEIFRIIDNYKVVEHATGSIKYTELSFDGSGSYFDFDMSMLEPGYSYGIKLAYYDDYISDYKPINKVFKFRVEKHET
tara:strand:+ start:1632 stop:3137 length:1506 start_codon:yes stop_codon:yes gene_type:complete